MNTTQKLALGAIVCLTVGYGLGTGDRPKSATQHPVTHTVVRTVTKTEVRTVTKQLPDSCKSLLSDFQKTEADIDAYENATAGTLDFQQNFYVAIIEKDFRKTNKAQATWRKIQDATVQPYDDMQQQKSLLSSALATCLKEAK